jgi:hypothetical protein
VGRFFAVTAHAKKFCLINIKWIGFTRLNPNENLQPNMRGVAVLRRRVAGLGWVKSGNQKVKICVVPSSKK